MFHVEICVTTPHQTFQRYYLNADRLVAETDRSGEITRIVIEREPPSKPKPKPKKKR